MQMKVLDFTNCPLPLAEKMLDIIKRCPNAGKVLVKKNFEKYSMCIPQKSISLKCVYISHE
jgi:hypothetical protein